MTVQKSQKQMLRMFAVDTMMIASVAPAHEKFWPGPLQCTRRPLVRL
jgi:hypothetical protein